MGGMGMGMGMGRARGRLTRGCTRLGRHDEAYGVDGVKLIWAGMDFFLGRIT